MDTDDSSAATTGQRGELANCTWNHLRSVIAIYRTVPVEPAYVGSDYRTSLGLALLLGLLLCGSCGDRLAPPEEAIDPTPVIRIDAESEVFSGGLVIVEEADGRNDLVESVELTYFNGQHWVILGRDDAFDPDAETPAERWAFWWDVSGLRPGSYWLRADMHQHHGGWGTTRREVDIASAASGRLQILDERSDLVTLSAEGFTDPNDSPLVHTWMLSTGVALEGATIEAQLEPSFPLLVFSHTATNRWNAVSTDVYMYLPRILLSLRDSAVNVALGVWERLLRDTIADKNRLKASLNAANQQHIDDANLKLSQAADKLREAKGHLAARPPNEAAARAALAEAKRLIDEAIAALDRINQARPEIDANIAKLRGLFGTVGVALLETDALIDGINKLAAIIRDKKAVNLADPAKQRELEAAIRLMEEAKTLLDEAKAKLLETPPAVDEAKAKADQARQKIKEAGKKIEGIDPRPQGLTNNIELLKVLYLELGFVTGKLWLLAQVTLDDPHAGIGLPDLTRTQSTQYKPATGDLQMMTGDGWDDHVLYHEFDHHLLWMKNRKPLSGGKHWYDEDLSQPDPHPGHLRRRDAKKLAWSEGWANFSSCAKRKDPHYLDEGEDRQPARAHFTIEKDLERDRCRNTGEAAMHDNRNSGPNVEGSVSGILWDIFDGPANGAADADADGVSLAFKWIWKAINHKPEPETIEDFYRNLKKVLEDNSVAHDKPKLDKIFTDHGVSVP